MQSFQLLVRTPNPKDGPFIERVLNHIVQHTSLPVADPAKLGPHARMQHYHLVLDVSVAHYRQSVLAEPVHQQEERPPHLEVVPVPALLVVTSHHHEFQCSEDLFSVPQVHVTLQHSQIHDCYLFVYLHRLYYQSQHPNQRDKNIFSVIFQTINDCLYVENAGPITVGCN